MSDSSEEVIIVQQEVNVDDLQPSDVFHASGIASNVLSTLFDHLKNNIEAPNVVLKVSRQEIELDDDRIIPKGTIIVCNSDYAREGIARNYGHVKFQPKQVFVKERLAWSLEDVYFHVILPKLVDSNTTFLDLVKKERAKNISDISNTIFISCSSSIKFSYLVEVLKEKKVEYIWLPQFCRKDYENISHSIYFLKNNLEEILEEVKDHFLVVDKLKFHKTQALEYLIHTVYNNKFTIMMSKKEEEHLLSSFEKDLHKELSNIESINIHYMSIKKKKELDKEVKTILEEEMNTTIDNNYSNKYEIIAKDDYQRYLIKEKHMITKYDFLNEMVKNKIYDYILNLTLTKSKPILNYYQTMNSNFINDITQENINSISLTGKLFQHLSRYTEAKDYFKMALILSKILHTDISLDFSNRLTEIGDLYKDIGEYKSALDFYIESLNIKKLLNKGGIDNSMSSCLTSISLIFEEQGRYDDAIVCQRKALDLDKINYGNQHIEVGLDLSNLGSMYSKVNDFETSLNVLNQSLAIILESYGPYHSKTGVVYNNIACLYSDKQEYDKAIEIQSKVIKIDKELYGLNHIHLANDYSNLAVYLSFDSEESKKESLKYFFKALKIQLDTYKIHSSIASLLNNLAFTFLDLGNKDKAYFYGLKSVAMLKKLYGYDHPYTQSAIEAWGDPEGEVEEEDIEEKSKEEEKEEEEIKKESELILSAMKQFKTKDDLAEIFDEEDSNPGEEDSDEEVVKGNRKSRRMKKRKSFFHGMERKDLDESRKLKLRKSQKFTTKNLASMLENRKSMQRKKSVLVKTGFGSEFEVVIDWDEANQNLKEEEDDDDEEEEVIKKEEEEKAKPKRRTTKKKKKKKKKKEAELQGLKDFVPSVNDFRQLFGMKRKKP